MQVLSTARSLELPIVRMQVLNTARLLELPIVPFTTPRRLDLLRCARWHTGRS